MKICKICYLTKDESEFKTYKHKVNNKIYLNIDSYCKECRKMYDKEQHRIQRARRKDNERRNMETDNKL